MNILSHMCRRALTSLSAIILVALFSASCSRNITAQYGTSPKLSTQQALDGSAKEGDAVVMAESTDDKEISTEQIATAPEAEAAVPAEVKPAATEKGESKRSLKDYTVKKAAGVVLAAGSEVFKLKKNTSMTKATKKTMVEGDLRYAIIFLLLALIVALLGGFFTGGLGNLFALIAAIFAILGIVFLALWLIHM